MVGNLRMLVALVYSRHYINTCGLIVTWHQHDTNLEMGEGALPGT